MIMIFMEAQIQIERIISPIMGYRILSQKLQEIYLYYRNWILNSKSSLLLFL